MNRVRNALLLSLLALGALVLGWWLLREPRERDRPPEPPPTRPGPPQTPEGDAEAISQLRRELDTLRQGGKSKVAYRVGSAEELDGYRSWVDGHLRFATRGARPEVAPPSGFRLLELPGVAELLVEQQAERRGAGALVLRSGEALPWVLEVPHSFFDEGTLEIGLNAFVWRRARALLVNTVHRYRALASSPNDDAPDSDDDDTSPSDVAHAEASFFLTAHAACVDSLGDVGIVQLHGFSDASAPKADLVLSPAGSRADPVPIAQALERALGIRVAVYPTQIRKLGGTHNRQAHYSISVGRPFLHVEISKSLRKQLTQDPERLRRFADALLGSAG
jgi:hypothetical protein